MRIGLTNRLIIIAVILVISTILVMALMTGFSVRRMLQDEIVSQMRTELYSFERQVEKNRVPGLNLVNKEVLKQNIRGENLELRRALRSNCAILVNHNNTLVSFHFYKPDALPRDVLTDLYSKLQSPLQTYYELVINGEPYLGMIRPLTNVQYQNRVVDGVIICYASAASTIAFNNWMLRTLLLTAAVGIIFAIGVGYWAASHIAKPLQLLQEQADRFAKRRFDDNTSIQTGDELEALSLSLKAMGSSIQEHDIQQRTFFSNLSHELKTPLMSIQGYAEGIRDGLFPANAEALDIIIRESQKIKNQIEDITYLLKMDLIESFFTPAEVSINSVLATAIGQIEGIALLEDIDIQYLPVEDRLLTIDGAKIVIVLTNLLSNCCKYGKTTIIISTNIETAVISRAHAEGSDWFVIRIRDDGDGFSENDLTHLFDRFYKGSKAGTGLGMAIAQQITERHQGILEASNAPEGGAMFILRLPIM